MFDDAREHSERALRGIGYDGERGGKSRERLLREGIEVDRLVYDAPAALAR